MVNNQKKKSVSSTIGFIISILLAVVIVLFYRFVLTKDGIKGTNINNLSDEYSLDVYKYEDGSYCMIEDEDCNDYAFSIATETTNPKILIFDMDQTSFMLYKDKNLKLYDIKSQESKDINLDADYFDYQLNVVDNQVIGIFYQKNENSNYGYYNLITNKKMYDDSYTNISGTTVSEYLNASLYKDGKVSNYLLKTSEEKVEMETSESDTCGIYYTVNKVNDKFIYFENIDCDGTLSKNIYLNNKKKIANNILNINTSFYQDKLYILDNKVIKEYDIDGNLLTTSKEFNNIKQIINDYVIYLDNDNLKVYNLNTKEDKVVTKWNNTYLYDEIESKYYDNEGIYIVIYYPEQDSNGNYGMEYILNNNEIKESPITDN